MKNSLCLILGHKNLMTGNTYPQIPLSIWIQLLLLVVFVLNGIPDADAQTTRQLPDATFINQENNDSCLLVMVAGLKGKATWEDFKALIVKDQSLANCDVLSYDTPQKLDIEEHVDRISTLVQDHSSYKNKIFIGHSIGGFIIKLYTLRQLESDSSDDTALAKATFPDLILTYGTPLDTDSFSISFLKRAGARVFWPFVSPLRKEVFSFEQLQRINQRWRAVIKQKLVRHVNVFGIEDEIAPANIEEQSPVTVFIKGDHVGILAADRLDACPYLILRTIVSDPDADLSQLDCVISMQTIQ